MLYFAKMKQRFFLTICLLMCSLGGFAQQKSYDFEFYGWISPQYFVNSRQCAGARDGLLCLYPLAPDFTSSGEDLNDSWNHNFSAATTRFGAKIRLDDVLGAKVVGNIETDFTGQSDANIHLLRLRQANVKMMWEDVFALTAGHGWSVFCVPEMMPQMQDLNNGTPFHPFARLNHIRLDYSPCSLISLVGSLGWQRDYATVGIENKRDYTQQSRTMIPEFNLQLQFHHNGILAGFTGEAKVIQPRKEYSEQLTSFAANAFFNYKTSKLNFKLQALWGENMNDYCLFGGYYEFDQSLETPDNPFSYSSSAISALWCEVVYNWGRFSPAVFVGYASHENKARNYNKAYGSAMALDNIFRIAPRLDYHFTKDFLLSTSVEYTNVKYEDGVCKDRLDNYRLSLTLLYRFNSK